MLHELPSINVIFAAFQCDSMKHENGISCCEFF